MTLRHREQHPILRELRMRQLPVPRRHAGSKADIQPAGQHGLNLMNRKLMMHHELHVRLTTAEFAERLRNHSVPQRQGLVRHIGLSNVTPAQVAAGRRICEIVCVQNHYNVAHRNHDALIDRLAADRIAYVPFFRSADSHPSSPPSYLMWPCVLARRQCKSRWRGCFAVAPHILLIPGTSSLAHLRGNMTAATLRLSDEAFATLNALTQGRA